MKKAQRPKSGEKCPKRLSTGSKKPKSNREATETSGPTTQSNRTKGGIRASSTNPLFGEIHSKEALAGSEAARGWVLQVGAGWPVCVCTYARRSGKKAPKSAQEQPRAAKSGPRPAQDRPKSGQERPRAAQERFKRGQEGSWSGPGAILARFQSHLGAKNVDFR